MNYRLEYTAPKSTESVLITSGNVPLTFAQSTTPLIAVRDSLHLVVDKPNVGTYRMLFDSDTWPVANKDYYFIVKDTVRAEATLESESHLTLTNIVLSDNDNVAWHLADCVARVTSTSGVNDLMTNTARVWTEGRYLCVDCRDAGVAQVASINGVTRDLSLAAGVNRYAMEPGFYVVVVDGKSYKIAIK